MLGDPVSQAVAEASLPAAIAAVLQRVVDDSCRTFGPDLRSIVLFGSAAEGRLRATSDVNLVFVLKRFERTQVDALRETLRLAHAAARVTIMFLLEGELGDAAEAAAVKFADIARRRRVLFGEDVFATPLASREAKLRLLRQVLVNLALRLRERYALTSLREEQLALVVAESAGPLRAAAATLLELEGRPFGSAREALQLAAGQRTGAWDETLARVSQAREEGRLPPAVAGPTLFALIDLVGALRARVAALK